MDWADELHANGFYYAEVLDENRKLQYYVEDFVPRNQDERRERQNLAKAYIRKWCAKLLQDEAYATYAQNISTTRDLDAIFASCPGYLRRSHARLEAHFYPA
jgi:hypothetical protein